MLNKNGVLVLSVPNVKSLDVRILKSEHNGFAFVHLQYFSLISLMALLEDNGFEVVWDYTWGASFAQILCKLLGKRSETGSYESEDVSKFRNNNRIKYLFYDVFNPIFNMFANPFNLGAHIVVYAIRGYLE